MEGAVLNKASLVILEITNGFPRRVVIGNKMKKYSICQYEARNLSSLEEEFAFSQTNAILSKYFQAKIIDDMIISEKKEM